MIFLTRLFLCLFKHLACVACIVVGASRDIAILVDVDEKNIPFVVTLVDTLQVTDDKNHVGVVATKTSNAIHVAFSSPDSRNETLLLPKIRSAAKNVGFYSRSGEYRDSLLRVKELFTNQANGARDDVRKTLLFVTDRPKELIQGSSSLLNEVINLKVIQSCARNRVLFEFGSPVSQNQN